MLSFPRWKIITVLTICLLGVWYALPNFFNSEMRESLNSVLPKKTINLGLDLSGGSHLLLEVDFAAYLREQQGQLLDDIRVQLRKERIGYKNLIVKDGGISFLIRDILEQHNIEEILNGYRSEIDYSIENDFVIINYKPTEIERLKKQVIAQSIEIVRRRVDETGTREPIIQRQGDLRILLQVPGLEDPEMLKNLLGKTAKMSFHLMDEQNPFPATKIRAGAGKRLLRGSGEDEYRYFLVRKKVELGGDLLVDSQASFEQGQPVVTFRFNNQGGRKFADITKNNVGRPFAIVLDNQVISAPRINGPILQGSGIISGSFTVASANELALLLRSGALPAPLKVIEERTVGPSLGQDSIEAGKLAATIGIILVMVMMILFYGKFGLYSDVALIVNMILVIAALTLFQATLTLPGIAGMVLTMGMAVDANVLIFERIREEARLGKTPFAAIDHGFSQAFKTILDSNVTTLIATLLLFIYGSGPVKGFAVTLSIGIVCSMFSAILFTRMLVILWLNKNRPKELPI